MPKFVVTREVTQLETVEVEAGSKAEAERLAANWARPWNTKCVVVRTLNWKVLRRAD